MSGSQVVQLVLLLGLSGSFGLVLAMFVWNHVFHQRVRRRKPNDLDDEFDLS
ncbi:hypothetical protein ACEXQB_012895 [Herbiconiux sp. P18]|uniref:hypothetical protein n=1 Tax=Herbiconiux liangxiaofengii TaxID=3342795 RepID=UPI0035BBF912